MTLVLSVMNTRISLYPIYASRKCYAEEHTDFLMKGKGIKHYANH